MFNRILSTVMAAFGTAVAVFVALAYLAFADIYNPHTTATAFFALVCAWVVGRITWRGE